MKGETPDQAAVIPMRRRGDSAEVCLIRRRGSRKWGIPKGFIDEGDTPEEAALNEASEEAGLVGRISGGPLGTYEYEKFDDQLIVVVYLMDVAEERAVWDEMDVRERRWHPVAEIDDLLAEHPVSPLIARALKAMRSLR